MFVRKMAIFSDGKRSQLSVKLFDFKYKQTETHIFFTFKKATLILKYYIVQSTQAGGLMSPVSPIFLFTTNMVSFINGKIELAWLNLSYKVPQYQDETKRTRNIMLETTIYSLICVIALINNECFDNLIMRVKINPFELN